MNGERSGTILIRSGLYNPDNTGRVKAWSGRFTPSEYPAEDIGHGPAGADTLIDTNADLTYTVPSYSYSLPNFTSEYEDSYSLTKTYKAFSDIKELADIFTSPQTLRITQGNGQRTEIHLYGNDTLKDAARKINDAIASSFGQSKYTDNARNFCTLSENASSIKAGLIIRSIIPGRNGELYFSGSDELMNALGLNTVQASQESTYNITVHDASSRTIRTVTSTTGNILRGIVRPDIDVEFDHMAGTLASWNEKLGQYVLFSDKDYSAKLHIKDNGLHFQTGANQNENLSFRFADISAKSLGLDGVNVMNGELASHSVSIIDNAIDSILTQRTHILSFTDTIEHDMNNLMTSEANLEDARSRIIDSDYAKLLMRLAEFQILSSAGNAILIQANSQPELILSLLQN